jgi:hypothetical protein
MLHYTGHGNPTCLIFENDRGEANLLVRCAVLIMVAKHYLPSIRDYWNLVIRVAECGGANGAVSCRRGEDAVSLRQCMSLGECRQFLR